MARLGVALVGRTPPAPLRGATRARCVCRVHARLCVSDPGEPRKFCRPGGRAAPGRDRRHAGPLRIADAVAGDGSGDTRLLCARRSRTDPVVIGFRRAPFRGAHRRDGAEHRGDGAGLGGAGNQCAGLARRRALARGLWRRHRIGHGRGRDLGIADGRAVSRDRRQAHAARRANRRRGHWRQLCHRCAARRDPVGRHAVARRRVSVVGGLGAPARPRQPVVAAGRGGDGERAGIGSRAGIRRGRAGRRDPLWRAALWRAGARRRQRIAQHHGGAAQARRPVSCEIARVRHCGTKNGCSCCAIPG